MSGPETLRDREARIFSPRQLLTTAVLGVLAVISRQDFRKTFEKCSIAATAHQETRKPRFTWSMEGNSAILIMDAERYRVSPELPEGFHVADVRFEDDGARIRGSYKGLATESTGTIFIERRHVDAVHVRSSLSPRTACTVTVPYELSIDSCGNAAQDAATQSLRWFMPKRIEITLTPMERDAGFDLAMARHP